MRRQAALLPAPRLLWSSGGMEAFGRIVSANEMEQLSSLLDFFYFLYLLWSCGETSGVWGLRAVILSHFLVSHERV